MRTKTYKNTKLIKYSLYQEQIKKNVTSKIAYNLFYRFFFNFARATNADVWQAKEKKKEKVSEEKKI